MELSCAIYCSAVTFTAITCQCQANFSERLVHDAVQNNSDGESVTSCRLYCSGFIDDCGKRVKRILIIIEIINYAMTVIQAACRSGGRLPVTEFVPSIIDALLDRD